MNHNASANLRLAAALEFASRGWPVLPLEWIDDAGHCSCGATPCPSKPGKHPRGGIGSKSATTDGDKIRKWWARWPSANVGIATGRASGLLMIGPDGEKGIAELEALAAAHGPIPKTLRARSGSGGQHHFFRYPSDGVTITIGANHLGTSIDFRGEGGYAVAAPSVNENGPYTWEDDCEIADAPPWLIEWLRTKNQKSRRENPEPSSPGTRAGNASILERARQYLAEMPAGVQGEAGSNPTYNAARAMVYGFDLGQPGGLALMLSDYNPRCIPPWSEAELRHKIEDADTKPYDKPRGWLLVDQRGGSANTDQHTNPSSNPWPPPVPLVVLPEVPPFPVELLPEWMRKFVAALAEELQVPPDLPAVIVLVTAAAGIARKVVVSPRPGWEKEPTNLFGMVALLPGEKKSQTFRKALSPVVELEAELQERERPNVERAESNYKVADMRVQHLQLKIAKADAVEERSRLRAELATALEERQAVEMLALPHLSVDDDTPDKLAQELANQHGRLLVASAEARALENISLYGEQPNFDVYLKGHAGDDMKTGRIGRGRQSVKRPALSALFTPQPHVLETLGGTEALRGRSFLARWFYSLPQSLVGYRDVDPAAMSPATEEEYRNSMSAVWRTEYSSDGQGAEPYELRFTPDALRLLVHFLEWIERELRPGGRLYGMAGWGNKLGGMAVRFCGVLHVAGNLNPHAPWSRKLIDADTTKAAVELARDYAVGHARAAFALMSEDAKVTQAKKVLKWVRSRDDRFADFSKRDCFNGCRGTFETVDDLQPVLDLLERHFLLRPMDANRKAGPGRNPSPVYSVNPEAFTEVAITQKSHFTQKDESERPARVSADSAHSAHSPSQSAAPATNVPRRNSAESANSASIEDPANASPTSSHLLKRAKTKLALAAGSLFEEADLAPIFL